MRYSLSQFKQLIRVALVALPVLLLLGLNGRTVSLLRPTEAPLSAAPRATVVKQKVLLEAASPLGSYVAPAFALGWLPAAFPAAWLPRLVRRAVALTPVAGPAAFVAQQCRQRLLSTMLSPQAP